MKQLIFAIPVVLALVLPTSPQVVATRGTKLLQSVSTMSGACCAAITTVIPGDDTIPQNTEGEEVMTLAITPVSATSTLVIRVLASAAAGTTTRYITTALFQDSTADAIAATSAMVSSTNGTTVIPITYTMTSGTTSSTTFKVRIGPNTAATLTFNGVNGTRLFGAIPKSSITIDEILP